MSSLLPTPAKQQLIKFISTQAAIVGGVALVFTLGAQPSHAIQTNNSTVLGSSTSAQAGMVISPLFAWMPQFILQPLNLAPTPTPTPVATPRATVAQTTTKPASTSVRTSSPSVQGTPSTIPAAGQQILDLVNKERTSRGLNALTWNSKLASSAQSYAEQMQKYAFFDHVSKVDNSTMKDRNEAAGYTNWSWMGENIAYGQTSAEEVMTDWMNSPGHKANILNVKAKELGVGYAPGNTTYWVQEFGATF